MFHLAEHSEAMQRDFPSSTAKISQQKPALHLLFIIFATLNCINWRVPLTTCRAFVFKPHQNVILTSQTFCCTYIHTYITKPIQLMHDCVAMKRNKYKDEVYIIKYYDVNLTNSAKDCQHMYILTRLIPINNLWFLYLLSFHSSPILHHLKPLLHEVNLYLLFSIFSLVIAQT